MGLRTAISRMFARKAGGEKRSRYVSGLTLGDPALAAFFGVGSATAAGVAITPDNARECPEVDACVGLNEDTVATVPLDFYERTGDQGRERRDDHPLHELLHDRPNAWQTSCEFRQMLEGWCETHGNAHARVIPGPKGLAQALEPVPPGEMRPFRAPGGTVAYRWSPPDSSPRTLLQHEVLHLKDRPFTRDMMSGQSRVERHKETIGRAVATGEYLSRFFSAGATPKTFLEVPEGKTPLTEPQIEAVREQFEKRHGGIENLRRIGVLNAGVKINQVGATNKDSELVETYGLVVAQIARVWGVPLHLIMETSNSTSWGTGIEQQSIGFIVYYMRPKFVRWEQALNATLMSSDMRRRFFFEFNIDGLLRGDFKSRMDGFALMIQWGLASPNEIRKLMNLPPMPGGDDRLVPLNMVPATRIMDVLLKQNAGVPNARAADIATRAIAAIIAATNGDEPPHLNGGHA